MLQDWLYLFAGATVLSAAGFVCVAVFWLRRLRETVSSALSEAAGQQVHTAKRISETIARLQKQQDSTNQQIQVLAQAGLRLQQELSSITNRLDNTQGEVHRGDQTLH
jgi:hypothetical protein